MIAEIVMPSWYERIRLAVRILFYGKCTIVGTLTINGEPISPYKP